MNRRVSKLVLAVVVIFASGVVAGGTMVVWYIKHRVDLLAYEGPIGGRRLVADLMRVKFGLSAEQAAAVQPIIEKAHRRVMAIRQQHNPEIVEILQEAYAGIRPHLNAAQVAEIDEFAARVWSRWETWQKLETVDGGGQG